MDKYEYLLKEIREGGQNFLKAYDSTEPIKATKIKKLLLCGMGGSGISADYIVALNMNQNLDIEVNKDYDIPAKMFDLAIITSYSGNTEETISMCLQLCEKKVDMIIISSGGELSDFALANGYRYVHVKEGLQPRAALPHLLGSLFGILWKLLNHDILKLALRDEIMRCSNLVFQDHVYTRLKAIAEASMKGIPVILTDTSFACVGTRFRCQLNENSKRIALNYVLPEYNHNGIVSFDGRNTTNQIVILAFQKGQGKRVSLHFEYYREKMNHQVFEMKIDSQNYLVQLLELTWKFDIISVLAAKIHEVDPLQVPSIDSLKRFLKDNI